MSDQILSRPAFGLLASGEPLVTTAGADLQKQLRRSVFGTQALMYGRRQQTNLAQVYLTTFTTAAGPVSIW